ncbi:MAG: hypothetical protein JNL63_12975 [Bacteroidia bacterium]|nr:hypothetical protein [Bacteroidia bacterium]
MELRYRGSFRRDYNSIGNKELIKALKKTIVEIKAAKNTSQISRLKRFKARSHNWYKIESRTVHGGKIYWILCVIRNNVVELRRVKPESFFKKNY